jgi:hypothetical protein
LTARPLLVDKAHEPPFSLEPRAGEVPPALKTVFAIAIAAALLLPVQAQTIEPATAAELLRSVLDRLPAKPLKVSGEISIRKRHGIVERELLFNMALNWGAAPATALYVIRDAFGSELEQMTVIRTPGSPPEYEYAAGNPPVRADLPSLGAPVQGTDFSWLDLSLSFLWWTSGRILGHEVVRGRQCYVVEVRPSPGDDCAYSSVRLWVDKEIRMMLQAEAYGKGGEPARKLWVRSVKRINDRWMIKDMDVESYPLAHRTKLTILEADEPAR